MRACTSCWPRPDCVDRTRQAGPSAGTEPGRDHGAHRMNIQTIRLHRIRIPYDTARRTPLARHDPYNMATARDEGMESLMVEVATTDGFTGWGESFGHMCNPSTWAALAQVVGPYLLGRAAGDPAALQADLRRTFHGFGQSGPVMYAISGVDIA